jgi:hypothetical protein
MKMTRQGRNLLAASLLLSACAAAGYGQQQNASSEIERLLQEEKAARASNNKQARLDAALKIRRLLNDSPHAIENTARAYADIGEAEHALAALSQLADMGQAEDKLLSGEDKSFAALEKLPQYQRILKRMAANKNAVSHAESMLTIPDAQLLAEDIDYDPQSKSFLITSVLEKKIIRLTLNGKAADFAQSPSHWPMLAIKIDSTHKLAWATEVAIDGFTAAPQSDWGHSAVLCYDLATGALRSRIEGPPHTALGDLGLTHDGTPIVSDGDGGGVYRVAGTRLERIDQGGFISPQTSTTHPDGKHFFVPDYERGIGVLDPESRKTVWFGSDGKYALSGIDGLYFSDGALIATQNGTSPERVVRFQLNSSLDKIVSEQMIERSTPTLGDPTHGVVVGNFFYYIANSGWDVLDEHGNLKAGSKMTPAGIMRFDLHYSQR